MSALVAPDIFNRRANPAAAWRAASLIGALALAASPAVAQPAVAQPALAQPAIAPNLTQLRPIQCIAYDPKPSDFYQNAYFDSDFFNADFTAIWGDDGK